VDIFEEERSEEEESYTEDTHIEPTIDQLFQRSFSFELREMYGGGEDMEASMVLVEGVMGTDVVILEDIASILAGDREILV